MKIKDINKIRARMLQVGLEDLFDVLVIMPEIPVNGFTNEFVIAEYNGMKIAKLINHKED